MPLTMPLTPPLTVGRACGMPRTFSMKPVVQCLALCLCLCGAMGCDGGEGGIPSLGPSIDPRTLRLERDLEVVPTEYVVSGAATTLSAGSSTLVVWNLDQPGAEARTEALSDGSFGPLPVRAEVGEELRIWAIDSEERWSDPLDIRLLTNGFVPRTAALSWCLSLEPSGVLDVRQGSTSLVIVNDCSERISFAEPTFWGDVVGRLEPPGSFDVLADGEYELNVSGPDGQDTALFLVFEGPGVSDRHTLTVRSVH